MEQSSPPSPNRPSAPGTGSGSGGGASQEIPGTRAAPNGKVLERANAFGAGFLKSVPDVARLAQEMRAPAQAAAAAPDYSDINKTEARRIYQRLAAQATPEQRRELDLLNAQLDS